MPFTNPAADTVEILGKNSRITALRSELEEARRANSGYDPHLAAAERRAEDAESELELANAKIKALEAAQLSKDGLITEWMLSNEAFKRVARKYGKSIGLTDEERVEDYQETIMDIAEEDPAYNETGMVKRIKAKKVNAKM